METTVLKSAMRASPEQGNATIPEIEKVVKEQFGLSLEELATQKRDMAYCYPRQVAMYLLVKYTRNTLKHVGQMLGGRDHTTVIHSCKAIQNMMDTEASVFFEIKSMTQKLISMAIPMIDSQEVLVSHYRRTLEILGKMRRAQHAWENGYAVSDKKAKKYWEDEADEYLDSLGRQPIIEIKS